MCACCRSVHICSIRQQSRGRGNTDGKVFVQCQMGSHTLARSYYFTFLFYIPLSTICSQLLCSPCNRPNGLMECKSIDHFNTNSHRSQCGATRAQPCCNSSDRNARCISMRYVAVSSDWKSRFAASAHGALNLYAYKNRMHILGAHRECDHQQRTCECT